jgi:integrase
MERAKAPGLKWRPRKNGRPVPYWVASEAAVSAGYTPKSVRLISQSDADIIARCNRLQAEMLLWMGGKKESVPQYDGTFGSLFRIYETDPESSYRKLRPSSLTPYDVYLRKLKSHIGDRLISACDGRDVSRWFAVWSAPDQPNGRRKTAAARMALAVMKAAISFGIICRLPACAEFRAILDQMEFEGLKPRTAAPTAKQVEALRQAAHAANAPERALLYALQFETILRLWDVAGDWVPLSDPRPSAVLGTACKWIGLTWAHVDADLVLRMTPEKTADTSEARVAIDLKECPMVVAELAHVPETKRSGPLIVDPTSGFPYLHRRLRYLWRKDADAAGIPKSTWNRDLRAGGITEAKEAGAPTDDVAKVAGHTDKRTTAVIYDRAALEAARRVAKARVGRRGGNGPGT